MGLKYNLRLFVAFFENLFASTLSILENYLIVNVFFRELSNFFIVLIKECFQ